MATARSTWATTDTGELKTFSGSQYKENKDNRNWGCKRVVGFAREVYENHKSDTYGGGL